MDAGEERQKAKVRGDTSAIWLIKSGDRILGPMTTDEVTTGIRNKEIVIIDEIVSPMTRWRLVRDEPRFEGVVEEVRRGQMNSREDTEVQGHTQTGTNSAPGAVAPLPSLSVAAFSGASSGARASNLPIDTSKAVDAEFTDEVAKPKSRPASLNNEVRQYGVHSSQGDYPRRTGLIKLAWLGAAAALGGAFAFYLSGPTHRSTSDAPAAPLGFERLVHEAGVAWERGEFAAALKLYRQANQTRANRPEVVSRLAPLMVQLEGETVAAKRLLAETLAGASDANNNVKSQIETALGLAAVVSEDYAEADAHFRIALNLVPGAFAPLLNSGTVSYLAKAVPEAVRRYSFAGEHSTALLMGALAIIKSDAGASGRKAADVLLGRSLQKFQDFRQEAYLLSAWLKLEDGNRKGALVDARSALDVDPDLTNDHWHDPLLYLEPVRWKALLPYCRRIAEELKFSTARALYGLCVFKSGDRDEATRVVTQALGQDPESALLQSVQAYLLLNAGRLEDARSSSRFATRVEVPPLALMVRARACARIGDMGCAESTWRELMAHDPASLSAMTGVADVLLQSDRLGHKSSKQQRADREAASELLSRARNLSPTYRPVIVLSESLN